MANKKRAARPPNPNSKTKPTSFRLDRKMIEMLDAVSQRLGRSRTEIVGLVLREYLVERGDAEIERIAREAEARDEPDLFA